MECGGKATALKAAADAAALQSRLGVAGAANVFLSTLVHRNDEQRDAAKALLLKAEDGELEVILPQFGSSSGFSALAT